MKDYTKDIGFWKRLQSFVSDVQTNCCMGEEEKQMIIHNCKLKILDIQSVTQSLPDWYKEFSLLELQMQELKYDMPRNLIERQGYVTDLETFDMKLTAMQNRLHRAFEELKGNVV